VGRISGADRWRLVRGHATAQPAPELRTAFELFWHRQLNPRSKPAAQRREAVWQWNNSLETIEIPERIESVNETECDDCRALRNVTFPAESKLQLISGFNGCLAMANIDLPRTVEIIDCS